MKSLMISALVLAAVTGQGAPPRSVERVEQACFADLQRFCPGRDGFTANACLQSNAPALSDVCRAAIGRPGLLPFDPFGENRPPSALTNSGIIRPGQRAGDRGVGGGIGGGEPHTTPGPFGGRGF